MRRGISIIYNYYVYLQLVPHSEHYQNVSKLVCYSTTMLTQKNSDHTILYRHDRPNYDQQLYHCNWPERASESFYAP